MGKAERLFQEAFQLYDREGATTESLLAILTKFKEALPLLQEAGDKEKEAVTNLGIGRIYSSQGKKLLALHYYNQALSLFHAEKNRFDEATTLWEIGKIYSSQGEKEIALDYYHKALSLLRKVENPSGEVNILIDIGRVYNSLGTQELAQIDENFKTTDDYIPAQFLLRTISNLRLSFANFSYVKLTTVALSFSGRNLLSSKIYGLNSAAASSGFGGSSGEDLSLASEIYARRARAGGEDTPLRKSTNQKANLAKTDLGEDTPPPEPNDLGANLKGVDLSFTDATLPPLDPNNTGVDALQDSSFFQESRRGMVGGLPESTHQEDNLDERTDSGEDPPRPDHNNLSYSSEPLIRYPNLDCPDNVILGEKFTLTVKLLIKPPSDKLEFTAIKIQDTGTDKLPEVEVTLISIDEENDTHGEFKNFFDIVGDGSNIQILKVNRDDDSKVTFQLLAKKLGQGKIYIQFRQNGRFLSMVERNVMVSEKPLEGKVPQSDTFTGMELESIADQSIPPHDIQLLVLSIKSILYFILTSNKHNIHYSSFNVGVVTLQSSPLETSKKIYKEIHKITKNSPATDEEKRLVELNLASKGKFLWDELIPEQLKQEYWKFKSHIGKQLLIIQLG